MNPKRIKIITIFGTRPEVIKLFPVLEKLKKNSDFKSIVVSTSQHKEMIEDLFDLFGIDPHHDLSIIMDNQSLTNISTRALSRVDPLLSELQPDLVLVQGDTTTAFIGALAAFYKKIPVGHVEAGLRSFNKMHPYPEEINRKLISVVGDLHFVPTLEAAENLKKEGVNPDNIFITGNTVIDALHYVSNKNRNTLENYLPLDVVSSHRVILVTAHRRENWGTPLENLCNGLKDLVDIYADIQVIYPVHLNPNVRKTVFQLLGNRERIHLLDPLPYEPFVEAMAKSYLIITDSGGIQEEGPSLQKPILVFRKVTERPDGIHSGGVKFIGLERKSVFKEASRLLNDPKAYRSMIANENPYGDGQSAKRIIQAIRHHFCLGPRPEDFIPKVKDTKKDTIGNSI
jgi:UDP-N-acetylglucosamine 2-epimerase (non-hydrolysing)